MKIELMVKSLPFIIKTPNAQNIFLTNWQEHAILSNLIDLFNLFSMNGEPSINLVEVVYFDEDDWAFGEADH